MVTHFNPQALSSRWLQREVPGQSVTCAFFDTPVFGDFNRFLLFGFLQGQFSCVGRCLQIAFSSVLFCPAKRCFFLCFLWVEF